MTGVLAFGCVRMPPEYQPDPSLFDRLEAFVFSQKITQYICGTCGAHVIERSTTREGPGSEPKTTYGIMFGTLKQSDYTLSGHIYVADSRDGGLADLLPTWKGRDIARYARYDDENATLPLYWQDEQAARITNDFNDRLHAYCKCGGFEFWIKRPQTATPSGSRPEPTQHGALCNPDLAEWVRAESGKFLACHCVCDSCRYSAGHEITSWALIPTADISLDRQGNIPFAPTFGSLRSFESSPGHVRSFCSKCGAKAFYQASKSNDTVDVAVGIVDAAEGALARTWIDWQLHRIGFAEDAVGRSDDLLQALQRGITAFKQHSES